MFDYVSPHTIAEACVYLSEHPQARPLLGGTDLLVQIRAGRKQPCCLVDLKQIAELDGVDELGDGGLSIGARVTLNRLLADARVRERYPVLHQALGMMAAYPVRNRATLAGNLANASPAADAAPPLLVLDARLEIAGPTGVRSLPVEGLFLGPGKTALEDGEIISRVVIPPDWAGCPGHYGRQARRRALDLAIVGVAVLGQRTLGGAEAWRWRLAAAAVAPVPLRLRRAEEELGLGPPGPEQIARAARAAAGEVQPISDVRGSEDYRRQMVEVHTRRSLEAVAAALGRGEPGPGAGAGAGAGPDGALV